MSKGGNFLGGACRTFSFYYPSLVICFSLTVLGESGISISPRLWTTNIYKVSWLPPEKKKRLFKTVGWEHSIKGETIDGYARTRIWMPFSTQIYTLLMGWGTGVWGQFVLDVCDRLLTRDAARGGREVTAWETELLVRWSYRNIFSTSHLNHI